MSAQRGSLASARLGDGGVHRTEDLADDFVRVRPVAVRHLVDGGGEQVVADEDVGVFGEEAEDQPRMKWFMSWRFSALPQSGLSLISST